MVENNHYLRRILYVDIGLVIVVAIILSFIVIPSVLTHESIQAEPENFIPGILFVFILKLSVVAGLARTINGWQKSGHPDKSLLIGMGVLLLILSLLALDGATAYSDHKDPVTRKVTIALFICTGCNFIASCLVLITVLLPRRLARPAS